MAVGQTEATGGGGLVEGVSPKGFVDHLEKVTAAMKKLEPDRWRSDVIPDYGDILQAPANISRNGPGCVDLQQNARSFLPRLGAQPSVSLEILQNIGKFQGVGAKRGANPPTTRPSVQEDLIPPRGLVVGRLEARRSGFTDPERPEDIGVLAHDPLRDGKILDNHRRIGFPIDLIDGNRPFPLGGMAGGESFRAKVPEVFVNPPGVFQVLVVSKKLTPDLALRSRVQFHDPKVALMPREKTERTEGFQGAQGQGPQIGGVAGNPIDVRTIFPLDKGNPPRRGLAKGRKREVGCRPGLQKPKGRTGEQGEGGAKEFGNPEHRDWLENAVSKYPGEPSLCPRS